MSFRIAKESAWMMKSGQLTIEEEEALLRSQIVSKPAPRRGKAPAHKWTRTDEDQLLTIYQQNRCDITKTVQAFRRTCQMRFNPVACRLRRLISDGRVPKISAEVKISHRNIALDNYSPSPSNEYVCSTSSVGTTPDSNSSSAESPEKTIDTFSRELNQQPVLLTSEECNDICKISPQDFLEEGDIQESLPPDVLDLYNSLNDDPDFKGFDSEMVRCLESSREGIRVLVDDPEKALNELFACIQ